MSKRALFLLVAIATVCLLALGYHVAGRAGVYSPQPIDWPDAAVRVAVTTNCYPLYYEDGGRARGFFPDLLEQAPLAGRPWVMSAVGERDALAALNARSVDLALLAMPRRHEGDPLPASPPLLTSRLSLFSARPSLPAGGIGELAVAWYGPQAVPELLVRQGGQPVTVSSAAECLSRAASGQVAACAIDEAAGIAGALRLGLEDRLFVTGEPLATLEYRLVARSGSREAGAAIQEWGRSVQASGMLTALERRWLGVPVQAEADGRPSPWLAGLGLVSLASTTAAAGMVRRYRSLKRSVKARSVQWLESEARYQALIRGANDAVFILAPEQAAILQVNRRAEELTGYGRENLEQMRFHQLVPARQRRLLREWLVDSAEETRADEVPLVRADGSVATVEISSRTISSGDRSVRLCFVRDLSERRAMQREIERVTQLADRILDNMSNGVLTVDADCVITSCNRALALAIEADGAIVGRHIDEAVATGGESLSGIVLAAMATGEAARHHVNLQPAGGKPMPCAVTISLLHDGQATSGAVLVFTDLSQEAKAREELQRLAMLSALGQMSGVLAHDIRNRITGVHVGVQYLAEKFSEDDPRRQSMEFIRAETDRVVQIIDDILMLIRPGRIDKTPCRIGDILERVVRAQAPFAQERRVQVTASLGHELAPVRGDAVQLERALSNLVKNAIEAASEGGKVSINADMVTRDGDARGTEALRVRVVDDGPGIPANIRSKLFQPFVSEKHGGTGLGLSIAKRIVDEHSGTITVDSSERRGTAFTVVLPVINRREIL